VRDGAIEEWLSDDPSFARGLGFHDRDGKVPDLSKAGLAARRARMESRRSLLSAVDETHLSDDDRLDRAILLQHLDHDLFWLVDMDAPAKRPQFYEDLFAVNQYLDVPYAPIEERARAIVQHQEAALAAVAQIRDNVALPLSKPLAIVAARNAAGAAKYMREDVVKALKGVGDTAFQERFATANEALARQADTLAAWLKDEVAPHGDDSHVLGPERYQKLLRSQESLTTPLAEFKRMGEEDLARNEVAYQALVKKVKPLRIKAKDLLAVAGKQVQDARRFLVDHAIVTLPSADTATVRETPSYMRWNAASLFQSGPFETARSSFYQITLPDPTWPRKEQEEYVPFQGVLLSTTVHEVYPGHFVQGRYIERAPTKVQKMIWSYSFGEGWAHYTEQMMIGEEGFGKEDPQNRLGQLTDALLRDCRFLASIGIHTEGMSVDDATKLFVDRCHQDRPQAREQAVRGTFDPGYFAYTLGKLQILALREEAKRALGDKFSLRMFHDALLSHGTAPVALIRQRVLRDLGIGG
jgi:uncharacterized protein (DUF885 family)